MSGERILIVDDIETNLDVLGRRLQRQGYTVLVAHHGKEALAVLDQQDVDLIISDILMPVMDGYDLCRHCQLDDRLRQIPLIFYTSTYTDDKDRRLGLSLGARMFIIKPQSKSELLRVIDQALGKHQAAAESPQRQEKLALPEEEYAKMHGERLGDKLEQKLEQLERANRLLQKQLDEGEHLRHVLSESEKKYRILADASPIGVYLIQDGVLQYVNQCFMEATGYREAELIGKMSPLELVTEASRPLMIEQMDKRLAGEPALASYVCQSVTKQGDSVCFEVHGAITMHQGKPALVGALLNITARVQAEEALRQSEKQLRFIANHAPVMLAQCDDAKRYTFVNQSYAELFGLQVYELIGRYAKDILGDEVFSDACPHMNAALAGQRSAYNLTLPSASGSQRVVSVRYSPEHDETGRVVGFIAAAQDITERKQAEERAKTAHTMLNQAFERVSDAFVALDKDWRYTFVNARAAEIFNRQPEDLIGKHIWTEFPDGIDQPFHRAYERAMAEQEPVQFVDYYQPFDRWFENIVYPSPEGLSIYFHDITERKQAELELEKNREHLEERVEQRTRELAEANEHLQGLDRMKSMFIASMSHELRTPMNSILGFTDLILQGVSGEINDLQRDQLKRVHGAGKHLLLLISDIIDLSKVEAGKIEAYASDFELGEMLDEAVQNHCIVAEKKGLSLVLEPPLADIAMFTDRARLLQCLLNLVSNALKYSIQGSISISAQQLNEGVIIEVKDTGIGISEDESKQLFQPFVRLDSELTIKAGGTGLGLYLSRKLMTEVLAGSISVESQPGVGSCFRLHLPRRLMGQKNANALGDAA